MKECQSDGYCLLEVVTPGTRARINVHQVRLSHLRCRHKMPNAMSVMTERNEIESLRMKTAEVIKRLVSTDGDYPSAVSGVKLIRRQMPGFVACELLRPAFAVVVQGEMIVNV